MLPVYKAISLKHIITKGAHTEPWVIDVNTPGGIKTFVAKVYTTQQIEARNCVTAEVAGNILAKEFDFLVPNAAFIEFDEDFIMSLGAEEQVLLSNIDERVKFATEYIDAPYRFDTAMTKKQFSKLIDFELLYAFDNLIRNGDRGNRKPNLLFKKNDAFLIDHEMAFEIDNDTIGNFNNFDWEGKFAHYHISHRFLKHSTRKQKLQYFETFLEYLRNLNQNILHPYFTQLESLGYTTNKDLILGYLEHIKQNSVIFVNILGNFLR